MSRPIHVFKFGGSSVATAERIREVARLVAEEPVDVRRVVVVSALGGVTDALLAAVAQALRGDLDGYRQAVREIIARHEAVLAGVAPRAEHEALRAHLAALWTDLGELLDGVRLLRECSPRTRDLVVGLGERASAPLVAAALRQTGLDAQALDARNLIRTDDAFGEAEVDSAATRALTQAAFGEINDETVAVVTGFIASSPGGAQTTLGRSGSDYTATILAGALDAARVVIWTDVDGVLSADPRLVPGAFTLPSLHYREAAEMAYFGAKVLHPRTMRPLIQRGIPLAIKNTLRPEADGTQIVPLDSVEASESDEGGVVKAITSVRGVAVVMLEGTGLIGMPGMAARAFGAMAARGVNVLMISQASSEQSICLVVRESDAEAARAALSLAFEREIERGDVQEVSAVEGCAVVSAVGDRMREQPGLAGRLFSTLGRCRVNVRAIAQGASETNISVVVQDEAVPEAVRALHDAFMLPTRTVHLALAGPGGVGGALLRMIETNAEMLAERGVRIRLVGLANSRAFAWDARGIALKDAAQHLAGAKPTDDASGMLVNHLTAAHLDRLVFVDATASDALAERYADLLAHGVAVVTPNKRAGAGPQARFDRIQHLDAAQRRAGGRGGRPAFLYETTVGAALPVVSTLQGLTRTGDRVRGIDAVLSGTLAFVFSQMEAGAAFSEAVREAKALGFTEPDPREDLGGLDVARKLLILARDLGERAELADVRVESLIPAALEDAPTAEAFLGGLGAADASWRARLAEADASGKRLRYVGRYVRAEPGAPPVLRVAVEAVAADSPLFGLSGTDNLVAFTTDRYPAATPLVVRGPGAGPEQTASGVLADVLSAVG